MHQNLQNLYCVFFKIQNLEGIMSGLFDISGDDELFLFDSVQFIHDEGIIQLREIPLHRGVPVCVQL